MIVLIANAILNKEFLKKPFLIFFKEKAYVAVTGIFFLYLLSSFYSENLSSAIDSLRIKLPFLGLPVAFAYMKPLSKGKYHLLLYYFFYILFFSAIGILGIYLFDTNSFSKGYLQAQVLPTPIDHIRYSLMITFSIFIGLYLYRKNFFVKHNWEKHILLIGVGFLILFLHILSVRSGLVTFYLSALYLSVLFFYKKRSWKKFSLFILTAITLISLAYYTIPTFHNRINYSRYDISLYLHGYTPPQYSDARRFTSIHAGILVGNTNPLLGVGVGDIKNEIDHVYETEYPHFQHKDRLMPHNQFIMVYATCGIIGLIIFIVSILYPVLYKKSYRHILYTIFNIIIIASFFAEATIEGQIGSAFYTIFVLLGLQQIKSEN